MKPASTAGLLIFTLIVLCGASVFALPRMSIMSGAPCATCHVSPQGGGMRNEIGWGVSSMLGAVEYDDIGMGFMTAPLSNEVIDELLSIGLDARIQVARFGAPQLSVDDRGDALVTTPDRRVIPMQIQPYMAVMPHHTLTLYGTYAAGAGTFRGDFCDTPFAGQSCYEAQAIYKPSTSLPALRAGMIQPSMGVRHDDHTMLIRHDAANPRGTLIPPNYAELGAELTYRPRYWIHGEAGAFRAVNLADAIGNEAITSANDVAYLARLGWTPRLDFDSFSLVGSIGASTFGAGDFRMDNVFVGGGLLDRVSLFLEAANLSYGPTIDRQGRNLSALLSVQTYEWLVFEGRIEEARTFLDEELFRTRAAILGIQFFPVPYIELRPEYRLTRTETYAMGQYTIQLHLFY
ncbi:MAG: hypothetical protein ACNA8W_08900 [Bradymonadaceae bacterium]